MNDSSPGGWELREWLGEDYAARNPFAGEVSAHLWATETAEFLNNPAARNPMLRLLKENFEDVSLSMAAIENF